jgi:hypothetical protein
MALEMLIDILTWMTCPRSIHVPRQADHWSEGHRGGRAFLARLFAGKRSYRIRARPMNTVIR